MEAAEVRMAMHSKAKESELAIQQLQHGTAQQGTAHAERTERVGSGRQDLLERDLGLVP